MNHDIFKASVVFFLVMLGAQAALRGHDPRHRPASREAGGTTPVTVPGEAAPARAAWQRGSDLPWWKGNLHTHSFWSDGDDFPEMIVEWYKQNGYHFLAISDHNILSLGSKWINPETHVAPERGLAAYRKYIDRFGPDWVETREEDGEFLVRLKPLNEFRHLFEEPGRFLLMQGEEISDQKVVHVNATNILEFIPPQGGETVVEIIDNNVTAVLKQRERTGQPMFPHVNHPNYRWAITAEELASVRRAQFFEVFNGHRGVNNYGDETRPGLDRMWDIVLTTRLAKLGLDVVYGLAVDDTHNYHEASPDTSRPGRGWIVVRARFLTPEHLIAAMEAGDFYATTGVTLRDFYIEENCYNVEIEPDSAVRYVIQFIGTPKGYDPTSHPVLDEEGHPLPVSRIYSSDVGAILAEVEGTTARYCFTGEEIYVRAKVISSRAHPNPFQEGDTEVAWTQPVVPIR